MSPQLQPGARNSIFDQQTGEDPIFPRSLHPNFVTATVQFWRCIKHGGPYEYIMGTDMRPEAWSDPTGLGPIWPCGCSIYGGVGVTWNRPAREHTTPEQLYEEEETLPDHATFIKPYYRNIQ